MNLISGIGIIYSSFQLEFMDAGFFAVAALFLDFLDGTAARLLKVKSEIGKELDSLADNVSFGIAPTFVLFNYYQNELPESSLYLITILIAVFATYRLAKFNVTEQSNEYFKGLPTPALAMTCFALPLAAEQFEKANIWLNNPVFIIIFIVIGSLLMVSNVKLLSIKLGSDNKTLNYIRIAMIIACAVLIVWLKFFGLILCLLVYLMFSLTAQSQLK